MNQMTGSTRVMKQVADFRERQRKQLNARNSQAAAKS
jgi:hypothetical protein